ncbi:RBPJ-interacting and tubulin-associated protein 1 [Pelobates fuscus]|uniref:RBPJ-interacting and tubulin-associated protein 1 n=1 Tax=Pelobates fuscus TaxID=191477 RepID=UPI002FE430A0
MSLDLSITGRQTSFPPRKGRSAYRVKAANSYVDETLFSSTPGRADPVLQWSPGPPSEVPHVWSQSETIETKGSTSSRTNRTPTGSPRKKTQYRVKSRTPSYCDETLFGQGIDDCGWEAPWVKKEDSIRLRPLLWCPTPVLRPQISKPVTNKFPVRAVHPPEGSESILGTYKGKGEFWKVPDNDSDCGGSPSVTGPSISARSHRRSSSRDTARSASWSGRGSIRKESGTMPQRPPWK